MTDEQIAQELAEHAKRIEQAEREEWFMPPIDIQEKAFKLRIQQMMNRIADSH